jgi:hypothetical protein
MGPSETGAVVELPTSAEGSWTLIATKANGPTCRLGSGEGWRTLTRKLRTEREGRAASSAGRICLRAGGPGGQAGPIRPPPRPGAAPRSFAKRLILLGKSDCLKFPTTCVIRINEQSRIGT